jgi:predicted RNA binding protein YcfA (HicA-like mRNA interferase family)
VGTVLLVKPEKLVKVLAKFGFKPARQKGSHLVLKNSEGVTTVVPMHKGEEIGPGILLKILQETGITKESFLEELRRI